MKKIFFLVTILSLLLPLISSAHYIAGPVNDAKDGTNANGREIYLWENSTGPSENITDIIGISGNSNTQNFFMFDCELLNSPCQIGGLLKIQIVSTADQYISEIIGINVSNHMPIIILQYLRE